jgi:beta-phosphoglucomutase-like phosphatase (HAD superfamily)
MEVANILLKKTKLSQNEITSICNETNSLFVSLVEKGISSKALYAGIKNLLRTIKQKHYLLIANSSSQNVDILLKKTNIYKEFDYVTNYDNLKGFSVDEKATLTPPVMAMNKLKLLGNECIAFDDSPQNIDILNKLNIFTIGITNYQDKKSFNSKMIYNSSQNINYEEVTFNYYKKYDSN